MSFSGQALPTDPVTWAESGGILGLIILFLLVAFSFLVRWLVTHIDKQADAHRRERSEWLAHHNELAKQQREERVKWEQGLEKLASMIETVRNK